MEKRMIIDRIPRQFCEGPFWGNGKMGTVMYVRDGKLCVSIDHVGLWELRETLPDEPKADFQTILKNKEAYLKGDKSLVEDTDIFANHIGRTRLPALAAELSLPGEITGFLADTDMEKAETNLCITLNGNIEITGRIWIDSLVNILYLELCGEKSQELSLKALGWDLDSPRLKPLKNWDYQTCSQEEEEGFHIVRQHFSGNQSAVLCACQEITDTGIYFVATIETGDNHREDEFTEKGKALTKSYLSDRETYQQKHEKDWKSYWAGFSIEIPNKRLQESFWQEMYKLYCNEREDSMPVTLQGIWNPDNRMPAWYGDLHNDLNVQSCYWPAYKTGNVNIVRPYVDYYVKAMPRLIQRAEKLFGIKDAIHIPTMMTPDGTGAASEWCYWNTILGPELFVAVDFTWFYEYSREEETLRGKIYPFIEKVLHLYQGIAVEKEDGFLHIPFTQSPEVDRDGHMLMEDDATFTLSCLHYLCRKMAQYAEILGFDKTEFIKWDRRLVSVEPTEKGLPLFPGIDVFGSHRHFCQLFPIFPLCEEAHNELANRSLNTAIDKGFLEYAAFSFPYMGIMAARCGRGNMCRTMLEIYCMVFRSRNTFTVNGDPYNNGVLKICDTNAGESADSFTLESGFFVPTTLCEMFVHRAGQNIWLMMGMPDEWKTGKCTGITVEGGHRISLERDDYHMKKAVLYPGCKEEITFCWKEEEELSAVLKNGKNVGAEVEINGNKCSIFVQPDEEWTFEFKERS